MLRKIIWKDNPNWEEIEDLNKDNDVLIATDPSSFQTFENIEKDLVNGASIIHSGLKCYESKDFMNLFLASQEWFLLDPSHKTTAISWKATGHFMYIKKGILLKICLETNYECQHMALADVAFQVLKAGGVVYNYPNPRIKNNCKVRVGARDLDLFVMRNFGKASNLFYCLFGSGKILKAFRLTENTTSQRVPFPLSQKPLRRLNSYTAIIPTLDRYEYLDKAIWSLVKNPYPPTEIIVVDQTPIQRRIHGYYDKFPPFIKVFFLDKPGQATARNLAIQKSINDWILFFDDDSEAWHDMIKEHIDVLEHSNADVSTGLSLAPWKDISFISSSISFYHLSQVLDTGNAMISKTTIYKIGFLDLAFDKGAGVDDEFGKRMYLNGAIIIFNPKSIRTHHKAKYGGLRNHGSMWKVRTKPLAEFPMYTESYNLLKYYPRKYYLIYVLHRLLKSFQRQNFINSVITVMLLPLKVMLSIYRGKKILDQK